jgi:hypothetical protein
MNFEDSATLIFSCYMLSIAIVLFSGGVPTKWRTWPVIHGIALSVPIMVLSASVFIAIPGLMIMLIVIAATSR